jgi:excinuclease UvrABC nuclease subunit
LDWSGLYDLFPDAPLAGAVAADAKWPATWPHGARCGVYFILDQNLGVRYVGKASHQLAIGGRLRNYFVSGPQQSCAVVHTNWSAPPRFVVTVAVPVDAPFEASSLEEYLIDVLQPPDNTLGCSK